MYYVMLQQREDHREIEVFKHDDLVPAWEYLQRACADIKYDGQETRYKSVIIYHDVGEPPNVKRSYVVGVDIK